MSLCNDATHQSRIAFRNPSEGEECRLDVGFTENLQQAIDIPFDPARQRIPVRAGNAIGEGLNLKIILHVHGHGIGWGPVILRGAGRRLRCGGY